MRQFDPDEVGTIGSPKGQVQAMSCDHRTFIDIPSRIHDSGLGRSQFPHPALYN
jgi:hypothetical protein